MTLKAYLKERRITQIRASTYIGVPQSYLSMHIRGKKELSIRYQCALAKFLGISLPEFKALSPLQMEVRNYDTTTLRGYLKDREIKQRQIAADLRIDQSRISLHVTKKTFLPDCLQRKLAKYLGITGQTLKDLSGEKDGDPKHDPWRT